MINDTWAAAPNLAGDLNHTPKVSAPSEDYVLLLRTEMRFDLRPRLQLGHWEQTRIDLTRFASCNYLERETLKLNRLSPILIQAQRSTSWQLGEQELSLVEDKNTGWSLLAALQWNAV